MGINPTGNRQGRLIKTENSWKARPASSREGQSQGANGASIRYMAWAQTDAGIPKARYKLPFLQPLGNCLASLSGLLWTFKFHII